MCSGLEELSLDISDQISFIFLFKSWRVISGHLRSDFIHICVQELKSYLRTSQIRSHKYLCSGVEELSLDISDQISLIFVFRSWRIISRYLRSDLINIFVQELKSYLWTSLIRSHLSVPTPSSSMEDRQVKTCWNVGGLRVHIASNCVKHKVKCNRNLYPV